MHIDSFYTSSFVLPNFPLVENIPFASLCPGSDGSFGFAVCLVPSDDGNFAGPIMDFPLAMLIIDVENAHVEEYQVSFSYKAFCDINLIYYAEPSTWLLAVDAVRDGGPIVQKLLDFYVVDSSTPPQWELVRSIKQTWERYIDESDGVEGISIGWEPWFGTFIEWRPMFTTLVKGRVNDDGLAEHNIELVHAQTPEHFTKYELRRGHRSISLVFDTSIVVFFCECPAETYAWNIRTSAFDLSGKLIASKDITPVPYPARREKHWVADDLEDWLWPTMSAIHGPFYGPKQVKTCVAALQLRDQPEKGHSFRRGRLLYAKEQLPEVQGGLFCIDPMGQILVQQECLLGESLRMCLCSDMVIGVDLMEGTWRLWSWSPVTTNTFEIQMDLQLDAKRVTLVPAESDDQYATPSFWLISENAAGIEVSLWVGPDWQSIRHHQAEHVRLPNRRAQAQLEREPSGIAAYQDSLLVMVIDRDYRLQLLRFR